jgi:hypothetical protein
MKLLQASLIFLLSAGIYSAEAADPFTIECQTLNAVTHQPQTTFHPGDKVAVSIVTEFPQTIPIGKKISVDLVANISIPGIPKAFKIKAGISGPNIQAPGIGLFQSGSETLSFNIPAQFPNASAALEVTASIKGAGKAACSSSITIE